MFAVVLVATLLVTLAADPAKATFPGSNGRIAFVRPDHGGADIFSADADGSHVRQLTTFAPEHSAYAPSWSADGSHIVFEREGPHGRRHQIWVMDADGADQHRILSDPWFTDRSPTFSPDGTKILFARCQDDPPPADQGRCAVATANVDGTGITRLTEPQAEEGVFSAMYSPDGTHIAFNVFYGRGVRAGIFVMNADGANVDLVTPPKLGAWMPDWAPDGSRLVFTTHCCDPKTRAIWAVNPGGSGLVQLTAPGERHDFQPVTSPDGTQIVFERDNADYSKYGLYTMNPDGTGIIRIIRRAYSAAWQPLGSPVSGG